MSENQKRHKRYERAKKPQRMRVTERDKQVIETIYRYRVLDTLQIKRLLFADKDRRVAERRLFKLWDHGYLDRRPPVSGSTTNPLASPVLYLLGKRGSEYLIAQCGYDEIRWQSRDNSVGYEYLEHLLAINTFRIEVALSCQQNQFDLAKWLDDTTLKQDYDRVHISGRRQPVAVIPDGYFAVDVPQGRIHFFLELDRGTMTSSRFKQKVQAYLAFNLAAEKRFGTRRFRVLVVTLSERRMENLKKASEDVDAESRFWFATLPELTTDNILTGKVWQVAGREGKRSALIG